MANMIMTAKDLIGKRFGNLTVLEVIKKTKTTARRCVCLCDCGSKSTPNFNHIKSGHTKSCGCLSIETAKKIFLKHGMSKTKSYQAWSGMHERCRNKKYKSWHRYDGRGIKICKRWYKFENFLKDMGHPSTKSHSLDRISNDGDYEPSNCRWATWQEQNSNKSTNRVIEFNGTKKTLKQWANQTGLGRVTLSCRLDRYKWSIEKALTTPARKKLYGL